MSIAWVTTCKKVRILEVEKAKEQLLKEKVEELTFKVFLIGYNSHFYLISDADRFVAAKELNITINLIRYDEEEYMHVNEFDFIPEEAFELIDNDGFIKICDFYDRYNWEGDTYKVTVNCLELYWLKKYAIEDLTVDLVDLEKGQIVLSATTNISDKED